MTKIYTAYYSSSRSSVPNDIYQENTEFFNTKYSNKKDDPVFC